MKKQILTILLFFPFLGWAQTVREASGMSDYMWMSIGNAGFTVNEVFYTTLAFSPSGIPYVAFDDIPNNHKVTVMSLHDTVWDYVGIPGFSPGGASYTSFAFSPDGAPYVAFQDWFNSDKASVMKYTGTDWVSVGTPGFSPDMATYTSLAINSAGEPWIVFNDKAQNWKATVMKFDGSNWVNVGQPGFSTESAMYERLALNPSGVPFVAFSDHSYSGNTSVMTFDGTTWSYVGAPGFSAGTCSGLSLAISPSGEPYVSYVDQGYNTTPSVMRFDGNQWVYVGPGGFTDHAVTCTSLAFSPAGEPYIGMEIFMLSVVGYRAAVMKFDGTNWQNVGNPGFSVGRIDTPSLAFNPEGDPCLGYVDYGNNGKATVMTYGPVAVGVNEEIRSGFRLYPNPAKNEALVEFKSETMENVVVSLLSIQGQVLKRVDFHPDRQADHKIRLDLSSLPAGIYGVKVVSPSGTSCSKLVKVK